MTRGALIFDLDGVVADTTPAHCRSWQRLADEEGIAFGRAENEQLLGRNREDSLRLFAGERELNEATRTDWLARKQSYFLECLAEMGPDDALPGVRALLEDARARGIPLGLASSSRNAHAVLRQLGLHALFDLIADGASVARPKPAPDIFLLVANSFALAPAACVVFEDSAAGVAAALAGGFRVVALGAQIAGATEHRASLAGARAQDFLSQ